MLENIFKHVLIKLSFLKKILNHDTLNTILFLCSSPQLVLWVLPFYMCQIKISRFLAHKLLGLIGYHVWEI